MSYVAAGYVLALATLASYAAWILRRRRALRRTVGADRPS